jgi:NADH:ubiquinone oxidoreductase subunit 6 (subunit J)
MVVPPLLQMFGAIAPHILSDRARAAEGTVKNIGLQLFQRYVVQFELASLVILVGVVGAVMLANRRKCNLQTQEVSPQSEPEIKRAA